MCATACHEGAIDIVDGKAKLVREHYCDGLGDCLPACPVDAIHFEHREAPAYDEAAVLAAKAAKQAEVSKTSPVFHGCPGTRSRVISHAGHNSGSNVASADGNGSTVSPPALPTVSMPTQVSLCSGPYRLSLSRYVPHTSTVPICSSPQTAQRTLTAASTSVL